jgi:hypothetical protein
MCLFVFICDCIHVNVYGNVIYELQNDVKMIHTHIYSRKFDSSGRDERSRTQLN